MRGLRAGLEGRTREQDATTVPVEAVQRAQNRRRPMAGSGVCDLQPAKIKLGRNQQIRTYCTMPLRALGAAMGRAGASAVS